MDFATAEGADRAVKATNGSHAWGVNIRVGRAGPRGSAKVHERRNWEEQESEREVLLPIAHLMLAIY